jgi:hypothetical protein
MQQILCFAKGKDLLFHHSIRGLTFSALHKLTIIESLEDIL